MKISQPFTIRLEATTDENQQYAEQRASRDAHLRAAQRLNKITIGSGLIAIVSLVILGISIWQSRTTFQMGQRAWILVNAINLPITEDKRLVDFSTTSTTPITFVVKNFGLSPGLHFWSETTSQLYGGGWR